MNEIRNKFEERKKLLIKLKEEKETSLKDSPEGSLKIRMNRGKVRYFHFMGNSSDVKNDSRISKTGAGERYLSLKEKDFISALAQKAYDTKILNCIEQELKAIERYLNTCPKVMPEDWYKELHSERQKMIVPIAPDWERLRADWLSLQYEGKGFDERIPEIYTDKGERVRSKSELLIANELYRADVAYRYEYPVYIKGFGTIYPDFMILSKKKQKEICWEHFGRMDDPEYAQKAIQKIAAYEENGYVIGENLVVTFETKQTILTTRKIQTVIERYLR
ncbi:MAG: hypothetical protein E7288_08930 [Lachnospiraceae bacterium]|nr:hypothetical protein [Lachnospiraceae bacterium]